jgi:hypothetical protein
MRRKNSSLPIKLDLFDESTLLLIFRGESEERSTLFLPILGNEEALDGVF